MGGGYERLGVLTLLLLAAMAACVLPGRDAFLEDNEMVTITATQMTLQWDAPESAVDHYTVCYRVHGEPDWIALADVPANPQPEYTIPHAVVGNGEFDFAVVAVDASAQRSDYHTSLDSTARPETGWYVSWNVP